MIGRWRITASRGACARSGLALLGAALIGLLGVWTRPGQLVDAAVFDLVNTLPAELRRALDAIARPWLPLLLAPVALALVAIGLWSRRWGEAATAAALPALIPLVRWLREDVVTRPDLGVRGYDVNTFPSTHAAAGFAMVLAILIMWPAPPSRAVVVAAAVAAGLIALGNVAWYAHRPVDVLGSAGLVAGCGFLLLALLPFRAWRRRGSAAP